MDPSSGKLTAFMTMLTKIMSAGNGLLVLQLVQNAINEGPNGTQTAPILSLVSVYDDVTAAAGTSSTTQTATVTITNFLNEALSFMQNQQTGLPHMFSVLSSLSSTP